MDLKRDLVKYVRDKAKSKYDKGTECRICGSKENLDFHHFYGLTELLEKWLREQKLVIQTAEEIMEMELESARKIELEKKRLANLKENDERHFDNYNRVHNIMLRRG